MKEERIIPIFAEGDVLAVRRIARQMAVDIGFDEAATEEIVLVVSELAANLARHAERGQLKLAPLVASGRTGIQIVSRDRGPGIADPDRAMEDGFSTAGTLGEGLGAVRRMMDEFEMHSSLDLGVGTVITSRRFVSEKPPATRVHPIDAGVATRSRFGVAANGDNFVLHHGPSESLVAVIDGVGHGQPAQLASCAARQYLERHHDGELASLFAGVESTCRSTRGVVMALARLNRQTQMLSFASVGNIEARVFGATEPVNFVVRRGIVGRRAPRPKVTQHRWERDSTLVLHSDGVHTHWDWRDVSQWASLAAGDMARHMLDKLSRGNDDATLLVMKERRQ